MLGWVATQPARKARKTMRLTGGDWIAWPAWIVWVGLLRHGPTAQRSDSSTVCGAAP